MGSVSHVLLEAPRMSLDFSALIERITENMVVGLTAGAGTISVRAKELAPIRKAFAGGRRKFRFLTAEEYAETTEARKAFGLKSLSIAPAHIQKNYSASSQRRRYATVVTGGDTKNMNVVLSRMVANPNKSAGDKGHIAFSGFETSTFGPKGGQTGGLTRRGRYELNSLRSMAGGMLGGTLRDEISVVPATVGVRSMSQVVSPTPYAKFQEFGTRHNPAHPYMRPAADESSQEVVSIIRDLVGTASKGGVGKVNLKLRLKP